MYTSSATPSYLGCGSTASTAAMEGMNSKAAHRAVRKVSQSWNFLTPSKSLVCRQSGEKSFALWLAAE